MVACGWKLVADQESMPRRVYSIAMVNAFASQRYPLAEGETVIGRDPACCHIALPGHHVSRTHAELIVKQGIVTVRDLSSANGTYVNGQRVNEAVLKSGDQVCFDTITLTLFAPEQDPDATVLYHHAPQVESEGTFFRGEESPQKGMNDEDSQLLSERRNKHDRRLIKSRRMNSLVEVWPFKSRWVIIAAVIVMVGAFMGIVMTTG